jgi:NADP-dependent 3-hydroxy acid dehydrogenase YdfG
VTSGDSRPTSRDSFAGFTGAVLDRFGRIDILVNNAGVMPLGDFLPEHYASSRATLDVNVRGLINGMRLVLPHMIERGTGHVVNVASMAGKLVIPGMAVYNASKFAAVGLSAAVREEYRDTGVSVTAVLPSAVRTRLASGVPLGHGMTCAMRTSRRFGPRRGRDGNDESGAEGRHHRRRCRGHRDGSDLAA